MLCPPWRQPGARPDSQRPGKQLGDRVGELVHPGRGPPKTEGPEAVLHPEDNPAGRALLWGDLIFLAAVSLLEANDLISQQVGVLCTVISVVLLLIALWLLFGKNNSKFGQGP